MANPVQAYVDTFVSAKAGGISTSLMFSFALTQEFQAEVPIKINVSANLSSPGGVYIYRSADGGNTYESYGNLALIMPSDVAGQTGSASHDITRTLVLDNGQYTILVLTNTGTAATFSCELLTARLISAYA